MAESCPGSSFHKLDTLRAWHVRDETYAKTLAEIVNYQHQLPFAANWGGGTTSSSDGQRYPVGGRGQHPGSVNLPWYKRRKAWNDCRPQWRTAMWRLKATAMYLWQMIPRSRWNAVMRSCFELASMDTSVACN
jgi:hypothetical protein